MAAWFPTLRPEEPFSSAVARYSDAMAFPHPSDLAGNLYGTHTDYPAPAFPGLLEAFVARLPPGHGHTATQLILRHTPFPYFAPFYPRHRVARAADEMRVRRVETDAHALFFERHEDDRPAPLRYCPKCFASDASSGDGVPCWRRVHLLPGVLACPEHRVRLWVSSMAPKVWSRSQRDTLPNVRSLATAIEDSAAECALTEESLPLALDVADDSLWLLRHPQLADSLPTVMERHRALLSNTGWMDERGRPRYADLERMLAGYSAGLVKAAFGHSPHSAQLYLGWTRRMFGGDERPVVPLFHILQWRALGLSAEEFFSGAPPPVVRRVPRTRAQQGPCRNPTCERVGVPPDVPAGPAEILVVGCSKCSSLYAERKDGGRRRWKLLRVGDGWMARFTELAAEGAQLPELARALGASKRRVLQEALTRREWPRCWLRELRRAAEAAQKAAGDWQKSGAQYRQQWVSTSSRGWGLDWALAEAGAAFRWLLRFDASYLGNNTDEPSVLSGWRHVAGPQLVVLV